MPDMRLRTSSVVAMLGLALSCTGCGSEPASAAAGANAPAPGMPKLHTGSDEGALSDLQASAEWKAPRCRWLETTAHSLFYPQDTAVLMAARDLGYAQVQQVGMGNRIGTPEPAWSVALTETGKAESARCGKGSERSTVFGVPVTERRFISGKRIGEPDMYNPDRTMFEVEFEWTPTPAGERVKNVLTSHMTVEQGLATAKVAMYYGPSVFRKGPNGWAVHAIHDTRMTYGR